MSKLTKDNKFDVKVGDIIDFGHDAYEVMTVINGGRNSVSFTLRELQTMRTIYAYPSSYCYGADVIKGGAINELIKGGMVSD